MKRKSNKGVLYSLESVIAILMIFFILILLFQRTSISVESKTINYKLKAYNALKILDDYSNLRNDVIENNATSIKYKLNQHIPLSFAVVIYDETTNVTEFPSVVNEQSNVLSISYLLSGDDDLYKPRDVKIYMWGFE